MDNEDIQRRRDSKVEDGRDHAFSNISRKGSIGASESVIRRKSYKKGQCALNICKNVDAKPRIIELR